MCDEDAWAASESTRLWESYELLVHVLRPRTLKRSWRGWRHAGIPEKGRPPSGTSPRTQARQVPCRQLQIGHPSASCCEWNPTLASLICIHDLGHIHAKLGVVGTLDKRVVSQVWSLNDDLADYSSCDSDGWLPWTAQSILKPSTFQKHPASYHIDQVVVWRAAMMTSCSLALHLPQAHEQQILVQQH